MLDTRYFEAHLKARTWLDAPARSNKPTKEERILELLKMDPLNSLALAKILKTSKSNIENSLLNLQAIGKVKSICVNRRGRVDVEWRCA